MIYPNNFEHKIEFTRIRQLIADRCLSSLGREKVEEMHFSDSYREVTTLLQQTEEFVKIIAEEDSFPTAHFYDMRPVLHCIKVVGSWIDRSALFELRRSLETLNAIIAFLRREEESPYPALKELTDGIDAYPEITRRIDGILDEHGEIKDQASAKLREIRRELSSVEGGISRSLNSILRKAQAEGYVDKDVAPSMRDGRLVIPVNPSYKRKIRGIVHDESASGKTVFIEPAEVVEANNRIRELEGEERREIIRILSEFTECFVPSDHSCFCRMSFWQRLI